MLTHREARRKLGSRTVRRVGTESKRNRAGSFRKATRTKVAVSVRALIEASRA